MNYHIIFSSSFRGEKDNPGGAQLEAAGGAGDSCVKRISGTNGGNGVREGAAHDYCPLERGKENTGDVTSRG
ncbi:hypothetical protein E2C01_074069 [Portunus trituberculatus]|uniref:Uncharacterized protein n=1 Tax=Portunus trituberculatus TaxID=210409 RepID=A0A5B7I4M2_PORTR|nr:hypothetical protein [Portunus trituberculatus]